MMIMEALRTHENPLKPLYDQCRTWPRHSYQTP